MALKGLAARLAFGFSLASGLAGCVNNAKTEAPKQTFAVYSLPERSIPKGAFDVNKDGILDLYRREDGSLYMKIGNAYLYFDYDPNGKDFKIQFVHLWPEDRINTFEKLYPLIKLSDFSCGTGTDTVENDQLKQRVIRFSMPKDKDFEATETWINNQLVRSKIINTKTNEQVYGVIWNDSSKEYEVTLNKLPK